MSPWPMARNSSVAGAARGSEWVEHWDLVPEPAPVFERVVLEDSPVLSPPLTLAAMNAVRSALSQMAGDAALAAVELCMLEGVAPGSAVRLVFCARDNQSPVSQWSALRRLRELRPLLREVLRMAGVDAEPLLEVRSWTGASG